MVSKPKNLSKKIINLKSNHKSKTQQQVINPKKHSKPIQKKKISQICLNKSPLKVSKPNLKKSLSKIVKQSNPILQLQEERKQYILECLIKANQQLEEDKNSILYSENFCQEDISSSPLPHYYSELNESAEFQVLRKVQFAEQGPEIHRMVVDRAPPAKENQIFDEKKIWISSLLSKKPKKSSIKYLANMQKISSIMEEQSAVLSDLSQAKTHGSNKKSKQKDSSQTKVDLWRKCYCKYLSLSQNLPIDSQTLRVLYQEDDDHFLVNTTFSYTH